MKLFFWLCLVGGAYSYVLYPLLLLVLPRARRSAVTPTSAVRRISLVIAARNEAAKIVAKLENTLALQRLEGVELEVIVASDASDDGTDDIVASYGTGVKLARAAQRNGKEHAQGGAIRASTGDILVFTDAATMLAPDALHHIVAAFAATGVGAVSSVDKFISDDGQVHGEGLYVRYEMWLRDQETLFGSLVGLSGSFFAARREICADWDEQVPSDFGTALNCVRHGMRAVSDPGVIGYYRNLADPSREYQRKVRTVTRGMMGLRRRAEVLNPLRFGRFAFQVFSHKVMRWAVPWFMIGALVSNIALLDEGIVYRLAVLGQIALYGVAGLARVVPRLRKLGIVTVCSFFVEVNIAIIDATIKTLRGRRMLTWEPSKR